MPYNWKCCSFYPNNFGASALSTASRRVSTGLWTCFHWPVDVFPLASGRDSTGLWTTPEGANLINGSTAL